MMAHTSLNRRLCAIAAAGFLLLSCANQVVLNPSFLHSPEAESSKTDLTKEPHLVWSRNLPAEPSAPTALLGNVLALPLKNRSVWFLDKKTGKKLGVYDLSGIPAGVVFDGRENLIIAEESGNGELLSYSLVDGGVNWRFALTEAGEVPIVKKGVADLTGTVLVANRGGGVYALRADDGKLLWKLPLTPLSCQPVWGDTVFWLADFEGKLNGCANGKVIQSHKQSSAVLALEAAGDKLLAGGGDSSVSCFSVFDGKPLWKVKTDGKVRSLAVGDSLVFFASTVGAVAACRVAQGGKLWERKLEALVNSPLLAAGGVVLAGTAEGRFLALSEKDGEILWERRIPGAPVGRPIFEGNTLFLATTFKRLLAFQF
ncbi:MAG: PQQ-binding-like beta-propeller repeat protein [candidate division Zixibacteria bacterium]|nr:PQQ-binding-like beta-propeller repeat protein [candidate division Zixibacteria bacterium]